MQLTNEQNENIQQYLDDTLTPEQEKDFMQEVEHNSSLQEAIQLGIDKNRIQNDELLRKL